MQDQVSALRLGRRCRRHDQLIQRANGECRRVATPSAAGQTRLLYLAPERLMTEQMLSALAKLDVRLIAVDEAHCISQWGPAFRPEY